MDYWLHLFIERIQVPDLIPYVANDYLNIELDMHIIRNFRQRYNLPPDGPCPQTPIIGFQHVALDWNTPNNHYCCFYFDVPRHAIHVIGYNYLSNENSTYPLSHPSCASFLQVCQRIYELHGWDLDRLDRVTVHQTNWRQNGYECGLVVCQAIESIWLHGFQLRGNYWNRPVFPCEHRMRLRILTDLHQYIDNDITVRFDLLPRILNYQELNTIFQMDWEGCVEMKEGLTTYFETALPGHRVENVRSTLEKAIRQCSQCRLPSAQPRAPSAQPRAPRNVQQVPRPPQPSLPPVPRASMNVQQVPRSPQPSLPPVPPPTPCNPEPPRRITMANDSDNDDNGGDEEDPAVANQGIHVRDFSQAQISRFARPEPPPDLPALVPGGQLRLHDEDLAHPFDDYQERPPRERLDPIPHRALNWAGGDLVHVANELILNPWLTHRDYGYRLEWDFAQAFNLPPPEAVMDHLMPVGLAHDEAYNLDDLLAIMADATQFSSDGEEMGPQQMINYAKSR